MNEVDMDFKLLRKREDLEKIVFGTEQEIVDEIFPDCWRRVIC